MQVVKNEWYPLFQVFDERGRQVDPDAMLMPVRRHRLMIIGHDDSVSQAMARERQRHFAEWPWSDWLDVIPQSVINALNARSK